MSGIGRVSGAMLSSKLDRQGSPLTFVTGATTLLHLDFSNSAIGINTETLTETLTINGNLSTSGVLIDSGTISAINNATLFLTGNVNLGSNATVKLTGGALADIMTTDGFGNLTWANASAVLGAQNFVGNITFDDSSISTSVVDGNVYIAGNGTGSVVVSNLVANGTALFGNIDAAAVNSTFYGNISGTTATFDTIAGVIQTANQPNVTTVGTLTSLMVAGNVDAPNINSTLHGDVYTDNIYGIDGNLTITPQAGTVLTINTTAAEILPTGNTAQRPSTIAGAFRYNNELNTPEYFNGSVWTPMSSQITSQTIISPDSVTSTFTLDNSTTAQAIIVSINGTLQQPYTAYTVTGNQITFAETPLQTDIIEVRFMTAVSTIEENTNTVTAGNVGVGTSSVVIDGFDKTIYRSAKYIASATAVNGDIQFSEVFVTHNGINAAITTPVDMNLGTGIVITYTTAIAGNSVRLIAVATAPGTVVRLQKLYFLV